MLHVFLSDPIHLLLSQPFCTDADSISQGHYTESLDHDTYLHQRVLMVNLFVPIKVNKILIEGRINR